MKLEKLAPWNWFKKEEEEDGATLPVRHAATETAGTVPALTRPLHDEIDRVFDSFFRGFGFPGFGGPLAPRGAASWLRPSLDLAASEKEYTVTVELPGVSADDVEVELRGDHLVIKGEKKHEEKESKKDFYRLERSYGAFQRTLSLPADADREGIGARFRDGVMTVAIPRVATRPAGTRTIEIEGK